MTKKIDLLFASGFRRVQRGLFRKQCLQLPVTISIFGELLVSPPERIEQAQLCVRRQQRLVIMRPV